MRKSIFVSVAFFVATAVGWAVIIAGGRDAAVNEAPAATPLPLQDTLGAGVDWAPLPACGEWAEVSAGLFDRYGPEAADATLAYTCGSGSVRDVMPSSRRGPLRGNRCSFWCERAHPLPKRADGEPHGWCCEMNGDSCAWTDGHAALTVVPLAGRNTTAYSPCARPGEREVECKPNMLDTAMMLDTDGSGRCSQICLPPGLWKVAVRHGVTNGTCAAEGRTEYVYSTAKAGVKFNVYARPAEAAGAGAGAAISRPAA